MLNALLLALAPTAGPQSYCPPTGWSPPVNDTVPPGTNSGTPGAYNGPGDGLNPTPPGGGGGGAAGGGTGGYSGPGDSINPNPNAPTSPIAGGSAGLPEDWSTVWLLQEPLLAQPARLSSWSEATTGGDDLGFDPLFSTRTGLAAKLRGELSSESSEIRAAAALALGRLGFEEDVDALVPLLQDAQIPVRDRAVLGIAATGTERGAEALLELAQGKAPREGAAAPDARTRDLALVALAVARRRGVSARADMVLAFRMRELEDETTEQALALYQSLMQSAPLEATQLRAAREGSGAAAARALGALDPWREESFALLTKALSSRSVEERRAAARTLGRRADAQSIAALRSAWNREKEPLTRGFLALAIGDTKQPEARAHLLDVLANGKKTLRHWAALGLARCVRGTTDEEAQVALQAGLDAERSESVRPAYLAAIGIAAQPQAADFLIAALAEESSPQARAVAVLALARVAPSAGHEALIACLEDPAALVRAVATQSLGSVGDVRDVARLAATLKDGGDVGLVRSAAHALSEHGTRRALTALDGLAFERTLSASRRALAIEALGRLLDPYETETLPALFERQSFTTLPGWLAPLFPVRV